MSTVKRYTPHHKLYTYNGHERSACSMEVEPDGRYVKATDYATLEAEAQKLREALSFYMSICGNTAYSVTRESAALAYAKGEAALAGAAAQKGTDPASTERK